MQIREIDERCQRLMRDEPLEACRDYGSTASRKCHQLESLTRPLAIIGTRRVHSASAMPAIEQPELWPLAPGAPSCTQITHG